MLSMAVCVSRKEILEERSIKPAADAKSADRLEAREDYESEGRPPLERIVNTKVKHEKYGIQEDSKEEGKPEMCGNSENISDHAQLSGYCIESLFLLSSISGPQC